MRSFVAARLLGTLALAAIATAVPAPAAEAQTADVLAGLVDGGFEAGSKGWSGVGIELPLDHSGSPHSGTKAAHLVAMAQGPIAITTPSGLIPTGGLAEHTLRVWVYDADPGISGIEAELEFDDSMGQRTSKIAVPVASSNTSGWQLVTVTLSSLEGTAYARVTVRATAAGPGATMYVDDVSLERGPLPPPPNPTTTASPAPPATATVRATTTASPTAPAATSTAAPTSTPTSEPAPASNSGPFDALTNGGFDDGLYGWGDVGADVDATDGGALLTSNSKSTKYLYQTVRITPGGWYAGSAHLILGPGVDAAWMRIAWYASDDGSGSQIATEDSNTISGGEGVSADVAAGPLQAPPDAHSAAVRIMLRPLSAGLAQLTVDDVRFGETPAPPPPAATAAAATPAPQAAAASSGSPPSASGATTTSAALPPPGDAAPRLVAGRPVVDAEDGGRPAASDGTRSSGGRAGNAPQSGAPSSTRAQPSLDGFAPEVMLRITELMSDPPAPGSDASFEWVEVTNVGLEPLALAGITLRDNAASLSLPDMVLQPGASLVLAAARAAVPEAAAFWPPGGLFNGLGNSGDRLALLTPDGRIIDALSYGSDTTYDNPPLPAPGAGRSLKRYVADDGTYAGYEVSDAPSPGRIEPPPASLQSASDADSTGSGASSLTVDTEDSTNWANWLVLAGLGGGALAAAGGQRVWAMRRQHR